MPYTQSQTETAIDWYGEGVSLDRIAEKIGKSVKSVRSKLICENIWVSPTPVQRYVKPVSVVKLEAKILACPWFNHQYAYFPIPGNDRCDCIYIIHCKGFYKLGKTQKPLKGRISSIQTGNPFPIEVTWQSPYSHVGSVLEGEYQVILTMIGKHHRGEWFSMSAQDIENIKKWYDEDKDMLTKTSRPNLRAKRLERTNMPRDEYYRQFGGMYGNDWGAVENRIEHVA